MKSECSSFYRGVRACPVEASFHALTRRCSNGVVAPRYKRMDPLRLCMTAVGVGFIVGGIFIMTRYRDEVSPSSSKLFAFDFAEPRRVRMCGRVRVWP